MAPLLPGISDSAESIDAVAEAAAAHQAQYLGGNVLFLKPGSKEWFMPMLSEAYPRLAPGYDSLYQKTYAPRDYTRKVLDLVGDSRRSWGLATKLAPRTMGVRQRQLELALTA